MVEPNKQDNTVHALGGGAKVGDARLVQKSLIDTKIPLKRSHVQHRQQKRSSAAYRDDDDDDPDKEDPGQGDERTTHEDNLPNKRQKLDNNGYESPVEEATNAPMMTEEQAATLRDTVSQSINDSAKVLPIAKHKDEIIRKLDRNRIVIISGDTGCGKTT